MKRRIQGLDETDPSAAGEVPDGLFLVRVERAQYRWHAKNPTTFSSSLSSSPSIWPGAPSSVVFTALRKRSGS